MGCRGPTCAVHVLAVVPCELASRGSCLGLRFPEPLCAECAPAAPSLAAVAGRAYLIRELRFSPATDGITAGLDLDGIDAGEAVLGPVATCEEREKDYASELGLPFPGLDNAGQALIATAELISAGSLRRNIRPSANAYPSASGSIR